jgi:uncharacterized RmlC-like cupin family protein
MPVMEGTTSACKKLRPGESFVGKQGLQYAVGISAESVASQAIHMQLGNAGGLRPIAANA